MEDNLSDKHIQSRWIEGDIIRDGWQEELLRHTNYLRRTWIDSSPKCCRGHGLRMIPILAGEAMMLLLLMMMMKSFS